MPGSPLGQPVKNPCAEVLTYGGAVSGAADVRRSRFKMKNGRDTPGRFVSPVFYRNREAQELDFGG
jgi:hypothetical protein